MRLSRLVTSWHLNGDALRTSRVGSCCARHISIAISVLALASTVHAAETPAALTAPIRAEIEAGRLQGAIEAGRALARFVLERKFEDVQRQLPAPPDGWSLTRFVRPPEDSNLVLDAEATFQADYRGPLGAEISVRLEGRRGSVSRDLTRYVLEAPDADRFVRPLNLFVRGRWGTSADGRPELLLRQVLDSEWEHDDDCTFVRITGSPAMRREEIEWWGSKRFHGPLWLALSTFGGERTILSRISRPVGESLERIDDWLRTLDEPSDEFRVIPHSLRGDLLGVLRTLSVQQGVRFACAVRPAVEAWPPLGLPDSQISWTWPIARHACGVLALRGPILVTVHMAPDLGAEPTASGRATTDPHEDISLSSGRWRRWSRSGGSDVSWEIAVPGTAWRLTVGGDDRDGHVRAVAQRLSLDRVAHALR